MSHNEVIAVLETSNISQDNKAGQVIDCALPPNDEDSINEFLCKAYMRYFNERYQTYGRTVHLFSNHGMRPDDLDAKFSPFVTSETNASQAWARRKIVSIGFNGDRRQVASRDAPYLITFRPDIEDQSDLAAGYVCLKLANRPARFSGNVTDQQKTRKFAIWYDEGQRARKDTLVTSLRDCGINIVDFVLGSSQDTGAPSRLREAGVTTAIVLFSIDGHVAASNVAANQGWFPEWFIPGTNTGRGTDTNFYGRLGNQVEWRNAFGMTSDFRRDGVHQQPWYHAYREGCPDCPEPTVASQGGSNSPYVYDSLAMLFYGIQAAGPRLTPASLDRGLHSLPQSASIGPYRPAAYFSPGNYSYIKDATEIWWDPSGRAPESAASGCYRLPNDGARFRPGEWHAGDESVQSAGPCQGDAFQ